MIPTNRLYIEAVTARSVLDRIRQRAVNREPLSVEDLTHIGNAIERLEAACFEYRHAEIDLSVWEAAIEELEVEP